MPDDDIYFEQVPDEVYAIGEEPEEEQEDAAVDEKAGEDDMLPFERRIIAVQRRLKAPKSQFNKFGGYFFRSCEDILEGLKPLLEEYDLLMTLDDEIFYIQGRFYVKATVTVTDPFTGASRSVHSYAREPESRKGSDQSQVTGSCSSYARKYALNAMWLTDDNKDADSDEPEQKQQKQKQSQQPRAQQQPASVLAHCESCGTRYLFETQQQFQQFLAAPNCCQSPRWVVE